MPKKLPDIKIIDPRDSGPITRTPFFDDPSEENIQSESFQEFHHGPLNGYTFSKTASVPIQVTKQFMLGDWQILNNRQSQDTEGLELLDLQSYFQAISRLYHLKDFPESNTTEKLRLREMIRLDLRNDLLHGLSLETYILSDSSSSLGVRHDGLTKDRGVALFSNNNCDVAHIGADLYFEKSLSPLACSDELDSNLQDSPLTPEEFHLVRFYQRLLSSLFGMNSDRAGRIFQYLFGPIASTSVNAYPSVRLFFKLETEAERVSIQFAKNEILISSGFHPDQLFRGVVRAGRYLRCQRK